MVGRDRVGWVGEVVARSAGCCWAVDDYLGDGLFRLFRGRGGMSEHMKPLIRYTRELFLTDKTIRILLMISIAEENGTHIRPTLPIPT